MDLFLHLIPRGFIPWKNACKFFFFFWGGGGLANPLAEWNLWLHIYKTSGQPLMESWLKACLKYMVRTGPGKPGKSWNFTVAFSRSGKSWKRATGPGKCLKFVKLKWEIWNVWQTVKRINTEILGLQGLVWISESWKNHSESWKFVLGKGYKPW